MYSRIHSTVWTQLSKERDLNTKNTTPSSTGMQERKKPFLPKSRMHRTSSRQQHTGSRIIMIAVTRLVHIPQQPITRKMADNTRRIMAPSAKKPDLSM